MDQIRPPCCNLFFPDRSLPLHAMLVNCGHEFAENQQSYRWDGTRRGNREFVIWQYTVSGEGALDFDGVTIRQRPGDAMLLIVPEKHCYYLPADSPSWEVLFVTLSGAECVRLARECRRRRGGAPSYRCQPDSEVVRLAGCLYEECVAGTRFADRYAASAGAYQFMMTLLAESAGTSGQCAGDDFVAKVNDYCLKNLSKAISVDELAMRVGYSRWHFSRLCREKLGRSPRRYVLELKMRMAMRLLQTTRDSVKEVAGSCGFEDPAYFCKVFRRIYQVTPGVFRQTGAGSEPLGKYRR